VAAAHVAQPSVEGGHGGVGWVDRERGAPHRRVDRRDRGDEPVAPRGDLRRLELLPLGLPLDRDQLPDLRGEELGEARDVGDDGAVREQVTPCRRGARQTRGRPFPAPRCVSRPARCPCLPLACGWSDTAPGVRSAGLPPAA